VHEVDPQKGGAPLKVLKEELQDEARRAALFKDGVCLTEWHRTGDQQVVSLKLIAQEMLRSTPAYWGKTIELSVPGSLLQQDLEFKVPVVLYASPNNPGAEAVAGELADRFANLRVCTVRHARRRSSPWMALSRQPTFRGNALASRLKSADSPRTPQTGPPQATHFLLYLNKKTFMGEAGKRLAEEVKAAMAEGLQIKMAHENDEDRSGCAFSTFFETTPQELIDQDLYKELAIGFVGSELHRPVSRKLFAKALGAVPRKRGARPSLRLIRSSSPQLDFGSSFFSRGVRSC